MKIVAISANLGGYDKPAQWVGQVLSPGVQLEVHRLDDENFPPRPLAMTSRLQCGIPKWFGPDLFPGGDLYIWVDASMALTHPDAVMWFANNLAPEYDVALFRHPERKTVREEYEFCKRKIAEGNRYLLSRYKDEWWDEQYAALSLLNNPEFPFNPRLYASTAFAYRPNEMVRRVFKEVWFHKTRYLLHDQLALAYCVFIGGLMVNVLQDNYLKCPYITHVRKK